MNAIIRCSYGSCVVYPPKGVLTEGDSVTLPVSLIIPPGGDPASFALENISQAASAPAVGKNGKGEGSACIEAEGGSLVVREYLEVNPFLEPDEAGYIDHTIADGHSFCVGDMIDANVKTLVVLGAM